MHPNQHMANGVRRRVDGLGDGWAGAHRELGRGYHMSDVDALFGIEAFGHNTGERLFLEYEPDNYQNRMNRIRDFAVVGMFDRKTTLEAAYDDGNKLSLAFYLWTCRKLAAGQPKPPRFYFVIGGQEAPWTMIEHDIHTGEETGDRAVIRSAGDFRTVWQALGLSSLRDELRAWVLGGRA